MPSPSSQRSQSRGAALLIALVALLGLGLASPAVAQETRDVVQLRTLDNGLDVLVLPSDAVPIATVEITVKNGAFTEPPELNGLSHLYEHMFFKGNAVIPNQEAYLKRMRELGIVFNGTTGSERVNYFFTLPADNLREGLVFMKNAITSPRFDEEEFDKEKQVVLGEVDRNESSPYYWFHRAVSDELWYAHPTRKDSLGDRETITTATVDKMKTMQKRYYVPNNSVLVIAGDVDPEQAFAWAKETFSDWKKGPDPHVKWPVPEHPPLKENRYVVVEKKVQAPLVQFSWHGPSVDEDPKATYAADVLSYILSQPTSTFHKNLVESGITLGADLSYYTQAHTGPISVSAQVAPDKVDEAIPAILAEVEKLDDPDYFTDAQLESAKTILGVQDRYSREKLSSFAHTVSFWWASAGLDYYLDYVDNLNAVTREEIQRYVREYIQGKPYVLGVLASPEVAKAEGLDAAKLEELTAEATAPAGEQAQAGEEVAR